MATGVFVPKVPDAGDILLGEGVTYVNYNEVGEAIIGATQGGSKFKIEKKIINPKVDGMYGPVKGLQRAEIMIPKLTINFLKLNYTTLGYGVPSTVVDQGNYHEFSFDLNIEAADVLTNVAFVGQKHDGKAVKIIILNALNMGDIDLDFKEKGEVACPMEYWGFYAYATATTPPFQYLEYE
jgi:hypothetical protein